MLIEIIGGHRSIFRDKLFGDSIIVGHCCPSAQIAM